MVHRVSTSVAAWRSGDAGLAAAEPISRQAAALRACPLLPVLVHNRGRTSRYGPLVESTTGQRIRPAAVGGHIRGIALVTLRRMRADTRGDRGRRNPRRR